MRPIGLALRLRTFGTALPVLAVLLGCEVQEPGSEVTTSRIASDLFVKVEEASQGDGVEIFLSVPASASNIGVCALVSVGAGCDDKAAGYRQALSLGKGRDRMFFRLSLESVAIGAVYHVYDASARAQLGRFRLVDDRADPVEAGLGALSEAALRSELATLAGDDFNGRLAGTSENERAAESIIRTLESLGISPARPAGYLQEFTLGVGPMSGRKTANIVAMIPGTEPTLRDEYVIIGAHMDHAGTLQRGYTCSAGGSGDNICNGADDNGSGTVAVLNVAKALAAARTALKRSVILMWFSGEEEGLLGSRHYVERDPVVPLGKTVYMINLDMVGYMESNGNQLAALGAGTSESGSRIIQEIGRKYPDRDIRPTDRAGGGSDHVPFMQRGIPGVFFHTGVSNNRNYHRTSDHADRIDYPGMLMATRVAFETVIRVANEPALSVRSFAQREPLVTAEEARQTCHHLMQNPFVREALPDFTNGNDGSR